MNKIIEIEELGFPKSLIIRENALVSELIDTNYLVEELNEQLRQHDVVKQSEQLKCPYCGSEEIQIHQDCSTCDECKNMF